MKIYLSALALILVAGTTFSQPIGSDVARPLDVEGERTRIQADRLRVEAHYQQEEAACYERFAVTDCLRGVRVRRREALDELRRQDVLLNYAERKRKAMEQIERISEKSSPQRMEEAATSRREALEAQQEREDRAREKAAAAVGAKPGQGANQSPKKTPEQGRSADDIAKEQNQYNEKLKEAKEHRASREKSNAEKTGSAVKPLPQAP